MSEYICKDFERTNQVHTLKDAICLTQEEWDTITEEEVAAIQQSRWDNWIALIEAASIDPSVPEQSIDPATEV